MNANDPVYPKTKIINHVNNITEEIGDVVGIDLRTYLASMAMQGLLSKAGFSETIGDIVISSVAYADALISELQKPKQ